MTFRIPVLAALAVTVVAVPAPAADAAPVTVQLRIEGPTRTLFEGPVTTDVRTFHFTGDPTQHTCDGTKSGNGGDSPSPAPTRGGAIATASEVNGFAIKGKWFDGLGASFSEINGENVDFDANTNRYLVEYENGQAAQVGSCADWMVNGDDELFAYGDGTETILKLTGPATAKPGQAVGIKVVDQGTGAPVVGASVEGKTTGADGTATVGPYDARGDHAFKATRAKSIRSNALHVCVTDGADGFCGTSAPGTAPSGGASSQSAANPQTTAAPPTARDLLAPHGRLTSLKDGSRFEHGQGPRELKGSVGDDASGLLMVKLRLTRNVEGKCSSWSSKVERFKRTRCGVSHGWYFKIGSDAAWSYQLAEKLGPGRYVLDVQAVDKAYNRD